MTTFDLLYTNAIRGVMTEGVLETNERTGVKVRALPGLHFRVTDGFPLLTLRRIPIRIFVAEQIWFLTGSRKPDTLLRDYTRIWDDFTNINGVVSTAYGYRWRQAFGRDQIAGLVELLEREPTSRHGVVVTWDPRDDGLNPYRHKKNVPCPYTFTANIIGGKLHLHNIVRSNDMMLGCPHDVAGFALLQHILAARLGVGVGVYSHSISNAHIYEPHFEAAERLLEQQGQEDEIRLAAEREWLTRAETGDGALIDEIVGQLQGQYRPGPPIKGMKVVL